MEDLANKAMDIMWKNYILNLVKSWQIKYIKHDAGAEVGETVANYKVCDTGFKFFHYLIKIKINRIKIRDRIEM